MEKPTYPELLHALFQLNEFEAQLFDLHDQMFELRTRLLEPFAQLPPQDADAAAREAAPRKR